MFSFYEIFFIFSPQPLAARLPVQRVTSSSNTRRTDPGGRHDAYIVPSWCIVLGVNIIVFGSLICRGT